MKDDVNIDDGALAESISTALAEVLPDLEKRISADPKAFLDLVAVAAKAERQTEDMLRSAVIAARAGGHSWEAIGSRLGISRQAAHQRFGREAHDGAPASGDSGPGSNG